MARNFLNTLARLQSQVAELVGRLNKRRNSIKSHTRTSPRVSKRPKSPSELPFFENALPDDFRRDENFCVVERPFSPSPSLSPPTDHCSDDPFASLVELLIEVDHDMALLEFALVSSFSRRIRTEAEADAVQEMAILFSETIEWALAVGLISSRQLADRDPLLFVAVPRLAVFVGCLLLPNSPIGPNRLNSGAKPPFMFAESTRDLGYLARQLPLLRADQLWRLACWTSPFGLSEDETKSIDAAASATTSATTEVLIGVKGKMGIAPKTPTSLVFGWDTYGLHGIYKCISKVAGSLSTNHPAEYRDILQMAIEINEPSPSSALDEPETTSADEDLRPIRSIDVTPKSCLPDGSIRNVRLADLFDWKQVLDASTTNKTPFANLFQRRSSQVPHRKDSPEVPNSKLESPVEVGVDALECIEAEEVLKNDRHEFKKDQPIEESDDSTQPKSLLALLRSTLIEVATPAPNPNPLYPLAPWQPDRFVSDDEANPSSDRDTDEDESIIESDPVLRESRRWRSGAPRVGRECARCKARFMPLIRRRHHCRRCGHIFCAVCCSEKAPVASLFPITPPGQSTGVSVVRVCLDCAEFVRSGLAEALDQAVIPF